MPRRAPGAAPTRHSTRLILRVETAKRKYAEVSSEEDENFEQNQQVRGEDQRRVEEEQEEGDDSSSWSDTDTDSSDIKTEATQERVDPHPVQTAQTAPVNTASSTQTTAQTSAPVQVTTQTTVHTATPNTTQTIIRNTTHLNTTVQSATTTQTTVQNATTQTTTNAQITAQIPSTDLSHILLPAKSPYLRFYNSSNHFYGLSDESLQCYIRSAFNLHHIRQICFELGLSTRKTLNKRDGVEMIRRLILQLKWNYDVVQFNAMVDTINRIKPAYDRLPYLPPVMGPITILNRSLLLSNSFVRPPLPFDYQGQHGIKPITGSIFLEAADLKYFCTDFYFEIPRTFEPERKILLCLYQCKAPTNRTNPLNPNDPLSRIVTTSPELVSPTILDFTLNDGDLSYRDRFNGHSVLDITALCNRSQSNRLRCIKPPPSRCNLDNLVLEVIGLIPRAPLSAFVPAKIVAVNKSGFGYACLENEPVFKNRQEILQLLKPAHSDDISFVDDSITIDLRCPISLARIKRPVRFTQCKHPQCFDYQVFKEFALAGLARSKDVKCPVCFVTVARVAELVGCGLIKEILEDEGCRSLDRVKIGLNTGALIKEKDNQGITLESIDDDNVDEDEGSDGENGLRMVMQQLKPVIVPEVIPSDKHFTFIDLCDSDEENHYRNSNVIDLS